MPTSARRAALWGAAAWCVTAVRRSTYGHSGTGGPGRGFGLGMTAQRSGLLPWLPSVDYGVQKTSGIR